MAGFRHVVPNAVATAIDDGPTLPLAPLALYALLKLVAFDDRKAPKDLAGVFHCFQHYLKDDERRYGAEHDGEGVPYEYTGAYLLGVDGRPFLDAELAGTVVKVLARFAGHANITTTQRYMNARASSLAESMRQARERRVNRVEHADEATVQIG